MDERFLYCGNNKDDNKYDNWVKKALEFLPEEISQLPKDKLVFYSTICIDCNDAIIIPKQIRENRDIIILSERIFPKKDASEDQREVRYFIFAVLHEIAHAVKHQSDLIGSPEEEKTKNDEADGLAVSWYNKFVEKRNNPDLKQVTIEEINEIRAENEKVTKKSYEESSNQLLSPWGLGGTKGSYLCKSVAFWP